MGIPKLVQIFFREDTFLLFLPSPSGSFLIEEFALFLRRMREYASRVKGDRLIKCPQISVKKKDMSDVRLISEMCV